MKESEKNSDIDHLDLDIDLSENLENHLKDWLVEFCHDYDYCRITPKIRHHHLKINSSDLIEFIGHCDPSSLSEFEWFGFKSKAREQMTSLLNMSLKSSHRYHYQWCLTALNSFVDGRNRNT